MINQIPESHRDLFTDEARAIAFLATSMPDGSPQVTPVWFDLDGDYLRFNSVRGRVKDRNIRQRLQVALAVMAPGEPQRYVQIRGRIARHTEEGAREHIDRLAYKYLGRDSYPLSGIGVRVIYFLEADAVSTMG